MARKNKKKLTSYKVTIVDESTGDVVSTYSTQAAIFAGTTSKVEDTPDFMPTNVVFLGNAQELMLLLEHITNIIMTQLRKDWNEGKDNPDGKQYKELPN